MAEDYKVLRIPGKNGYVRIQVESEHYFSHLPYHRDYVGLYSKEPNEQGKYVISTGIPPYYGGPCEMTCFVTEPYLDTTVEYVVKAFMAHLRLTKLGEMALKNA